MSEEFEKEVERLVEEAGFELVTLERGGARNRPLLRLRIDRPGSEPGRSGVTADDCALVSRVLHERLEAGPYGLDKVVLEVSSPGVERPPVRRTSPTRHKVVTMHIMADTGALDG